ncbi:FlgK family flagellar hook-associated protein [Halarcobacter sp.]|uniref:FlgK family flagellar hook-associated protein n=1 Tax=Halarcobacter sp. TaxID=2321133 RepID=UPI003A912420
MLKSLNVAQSGLNASKYAIENISNNLANENTPGYKKRVVQLSELELIDSRFTGRGVRADNAYRITSQYMYDNMMNENTKSNYYSTISKITGSIEVMFSETDESGFSSDLDRYFQAIENLRTNPNSEIYRTTYKTQGKVLVESLQNLYSNIEKEEELTKISIEENVKKVNNLINEIGEVNQQLGQHIDASNDLLDKRDQLERELSQYVDIEVDRSNNEYTLKVGGEIAVRYNTNIREINLVEEFEPQIDRFSTNPPSGKPKDIIGENYDIGLGDKVSYKFNNEYEVSVEIGSNKFTDGQGNEYEIDFDGDGVADTVDETNYVRALSFAVNAHPEISEKVIAYNGDYAVDEEGNIVDNMGKDEFLRLDARNPGEAGSFQGRLVVKEADNPTVQSSNSVLPSDLVDPAGGDITVNVPGVGNTVFTVTGTTTYEDLINDINADPNLSAELNADGNLVIANKTTPDDGVTVIDNLTTPIGFSDTPKNSGSLFRDEYSSKNGEDKVFLSVYDKEITLKSGIIKAQTENLTTTSPNNKIIDYKEKLDNFARSLSDLFDKFVKTTSDGDYLYGHVASDNYSGDREIKNLNLFSGMDVMSLKFNEDAVNDLDQVDLDYMATMQWKKDIEFDGFAQDGSNFNNTSLSEFFQEIRVNVSSDKENNDFLLETQETVFQSIQFKFEQLTKVDPDEEMINLMQFQAAYTANAKIVTAVDEMIQTLLGM